MNTPHVVTEPNILYLGTPVVLVSTVNEDGTHNLAPISSAFWLGWRGVLGIASASQTTRNLLRTGECVLNLPSIDQVGAVDRIARTTGTYPVPEFKRAMGYVYEPDKFGRAGMTRVRSDTVAAARALECPIQLEAVVAAAHGIGEDSDQLRGFISLIEVRIQRVHVHPNLLMAGHANRIDPDKWSPLIMSFQKFYGLSAQVHPSRLAEIPERAYRSPDIERAQESKLLDSCA
ncbi:flavin reductase family protein [Paraburkholderia sp. DHOC27]|uniref:flavin reductase family protein n=1 Tax=Paraburkholderia sp. DHOC27 TaxID=2303330 RepID=UPI000E3CE718|nr:flavin reductase family protein [Paraburkholderia sp. DHOC27]RFU44903.1 flavin reductase family protein [Paraburkholderia sp. DHOC27]